MPAKGGPERKEEHMADLRPRRNPKLTREKSHEQSAQRSAFTNKAKPAARAKILDAQKKEEGRRLIGEAAFQLFVRYGYEATSVRSIADASGISVGSIFNYFDSKEDILGWVLGESQDVVEEVLANGEREMKVLQQRLAPAEVFREMYRRFIFTIHETRHYTALGYQELKVLSHEQQALLYEHAEQIAAMLKRAAEPGIQAGVFRANGIDAKIHWLIMLGHTWVLRNWWFRRFRLEDYAETLTKLGTALLSCDLEIPEQMAVQPLLGVLRPEACPKRLDSGDTRHIPPSSAVQICSDSACEEFGSCRYAAGGASEDG